ncbi:MAG: hypothetical protein IT379_39925 [Deltaproteobacteria bacterium]|nr:hypothetical protein [Deltaproteobacteria bacterium]
MVAQAPPTGIDVSAWQGQIHWPAVASAGHRFAIIKATEGVTYRSPQYERDRDGARASGLYVGSYHFLRWERGAASGSAQARHYHDVVGRLSPGDITPACDLEWITGHKRDADEIVKVVVDFLGECESRFGRWPMIYTGPTFWRYCLAPAKDELDLTSWPLWVVDYEPPLDPMVGAASWRWSIWQHTGSGSCPGISGKVDLNRARDLPTLLALAGLDPSKSEGTA